MHFGVALLCFGPWFRDDCSHPFSWLSLLRSNVSSIYVYINLYLYKTSRYTWCTNDLCKPSLANANGGQAPKSRAQFPRSTVPKYLGDLFLILPHSFRVHHISSPYKGDKIKWFRKKSNINTIEYHPIIFNTSIPLKGGSSVAATHWWPTSRRRGLPSAFQRRRSLMWRSKTWAGLVASTASWCDSGHKKKKPLGVTQSHPKSPKVT